MDASSLASRLLFTLGSSEKEEALFRGPSDLADEVMEALSSDYSNKRSLASFLGQILVRGDRSCPASLMDDIESAVERRARTLDRRNENLPRRVRRALESANYVRTGPQPLGTEELHAQLVDLAETAEHQLVITSRPLERLRSRRASDLQNILLRRLGILDYINDKSTEASTMYVFCLPGKEACRKWWKALFRETVSRSLSDLEQGGSGSLSVKEVKQKISTKLKSLDQKGYLKVFAVDRRVCGCPMVVFDPDGVMPAAFNLYYFNASAGIGEVSVSKMAMPYFEDWTENVYHELRIGILGDEGRVNYVHSEMESD